MLSQILWTSTGQ